MFGDRWAGISTDKQVLAPVACVLHFSALIIVFPRFESGETQHPQSPTDDVRHAAMQAHQCMVAFRFADHMLTFQIKK